MLSLDDLWIGDSIRSKKSGRRGTFEGIHASGKARLKSAGKIYLVLPKDIELFEAQDEEEEILFNDEVQDEVIDYGYSIDLHIEKLRPELENAVPERIIDIQIKSLISFIEDVIQSRKLQVTIIHGKGTGVLRQSVHQILQSYQEVKHFELINQGGATLVRL